MLKNYFILSLRNIWKNKFSSGTIVISLSIAVASCLLLFKYANYQLSFDKYNDKADRIYRIPYIKTADAQDITEFATNAPALAPWLKNHYPEVEDYVRIRTTDKDLYKYINDSNNINIIETDLAWVDTNFCNLFPLEFICGNCETAFSDPMSVVVSESFAQNTYGNTNVVGKKLNRFIVNEIYEIAGVYKDFPQNSYLNLNVLMSYEHVKGLEMYDSWSNIYAHTFILLRKDANPETFQNKLDQALKGELGRYLTEFLLGQYSDCNNYEDMITKHIFEYDFTMQSLTELNFSTLRNELKPGKEKRIVFFILGISGIIMIIAWINYFNLVVVSMLENAKVLQIRKIIGADKKNLFNLFVTDCIIINLFSMGLALLLYYLAYPYFIYLFDLPENVSSFSYFFQGIPGIFPFILFIVLLFVISLIFPLSMPFLKIFFFQSDFVKVFNPKRKWFKSTMVIIQFVFSVFMISSSITILKQMKFMNKTELGFNPEQIFVIPRPTNLTKDFVENYQSYQNAIIQNPYILNTIGATSVPPIEMLGQSIQDQTTNEKMMLSYIFFNKDYFDFFDVNMLAGEKFITGSEFMDSLNRKVIINKTACIKLGYNKPEEAIGKTLFMTENFIDEFRYFFSGGPAQIIGVCNDYYHKSVREKMPPTIFFQIPQARFLNYFCYNIEAENANETIDYIKEKWLEYFPDYPLNNYFFLDKKFEAEYKDDKQFGTISGIFTAIAVILASTGLFLLSSYSILKKIREVGIRKSNGARTDQIVLLFLKRFLSLTLLAYVIAMPASFFLMSKWLENYPYRISIDAWFFILPLAFLIFVSVGTIIIQVLKAAKTNPIEILRYE